MLSTVDLPQPEWPISETNSPLAIFRLTPRRAQNRPLSVGKLMPTPVSSRWVGCMTISLAQVGVLVPADAALQREHEAVEGEADQADDDHGDHDAAEGVGAA